MTEPIAEVGYLAGVCGSEDGTDWEKILIDASRRLVVAVASAMAQECQLYGWDGDSWEKLQVSDSKYLKVTLPLEEALGARAYQYDGATWRRGNLVLGYNDTVSESAEDTNLPVNYGTVYGTVVPEGEVWIISAIESRVISATCTSMISKMVVGGVSISMKVVSTPTSALPYLVTGNFVLAEDDRLIVEYAGLTAGDDGRLRYAGYKMKIDM